MKSDYLKIIGENIKNIRKEKKLTSEQFARKIELSKENISQLEHGKNGLSLKKFIELCVKCDCHISKILKGVLRDTLIEPPKYTRADECEDANYTKAIGENIKNIIEMKNISTKEFANALNLNIRTIQYIIKGERNITVETMLEICELYNLHIHHILKNVLPNKLI